MYKVMVILPNDVLGGAEWFLKNMSKYFLDQRSQVDVFFLKERITGAWEDIQNINYQTHYTKSKRELTGIIRIIPNLREAKSEYDIIFTSHVHVNAYVGFLRRTGIIRSKYHVARESTSIFLRYNGLRKIMHKFQYSFFYRKIDLVICQTELMKEQLINQVHSIADRVKVIPNPIPEEMMDRERVIPYDPGYEYIVGAGRLIPEKGFDLLILAFQEIKKHFPDLKLIILGEGEGREELERLPKRESIVDDVLLPGFVEDVLPFFKGARACVVSSRVEGFPNVLLQMMAQNDRVVSTLCAGGIDEIDGIFTCPPDSIEGLSGTLIEALKNPCISTREAFEKELSKRSVEHFINEVYYNIR